MLCISHTAQLARRIDLDFKSSIHLIRDRIGDLRQRFLHFYLLCISKQVSYICMFRSCYCSRQSLQSSPPATPDLAISSQHQFILQYPASSANMLFVTSAHESCFYYNLQYASCKIWWTKCYWGLSASCLNILLFAATVLSEVTKDQLLCVAK